MNKVEQQTAVMSHDEVRELVARFMDGATEPAQEKALYSFFSMAPAGSLEPDLEALRPMFGWYAGLQEAAATEPVRRSWWIRFRGRVIAGAAAAAVVAVMVTAGIGLFGKKQPAATDSLYASYEGSYIVRNGVRTTDLAVIYATVAAAEHMADSLNRSADRVLMADLDYDRQAIDEALSAISDPVLAAQLRHDLLD
ncbi:MAG: hypothetical protein HDS72_02510 [Bacteroidales bacterium]|nr:hypothetical protein [Bacteroidales bacterium]